MIRGTTDVKRPVIQPCDLAPNPPTSSTPSTPFVRPFCDQLISGHLRFRRCVRFVELSTPLESLPSCSALNLADGDLRADDTCFPRAPNQPWALRLTLSRPSPRHRLRPFCDQLISGHLLFRELSTPLKIF
jgi:hypothetical protein